MALTRVRIADTEAIAQYITIPQGIVIKRIMTYNHNGKGRRLIRIDPEGRLDLIAIIAEELAA